MVTKVINILQFQLEEILMIWIVISHINFDINKKMAVNHNSPSAVSIVISSDETFQPATPNVDEDNATTGQKQGNRRGGLRVKISDSLEVSHVNGHANRQAPKPSRLQVNEDLVGIRRSAKEQAMVGDPNTIRRGSLFRSENVLNSATAKRRGTIGPSLIQSQLTNSQLVSSSSGLMGSGGLRRGSMNPLGFNPKARKSRTGSTVNEFITRLRRKSSNTKLLGRRESSFSLKSDTAQSVDTGPTVDKVKCRKKFQLWIQVVTQLMKMRMRYRITMWGSTSVYRDQIEDIKRCAAKASEEILHYSDFNPNEYKANKQMRMSVKAKQILQREPSDRSEEDVIYAMIALRAIPEIAEYPVRMQKVLAQFGDFECYESQCAIVKQGHAPLAFYFILFGTVIVAVRPDDVQDAKTQVKLRRGQSFGELSIISGDNRQSTVITQEYSEFLSIDVRTYERLFMSGGAKNINDPDHNKFMDSLSFLRGWPKKNLKDRDQVKFFYFKRGAVMVKDSNYSDWIIIVKSGSVQVLKKLLKKSPTIDIRTGRPIPKRSATDVHIDFLDSRAASSCLMNYPPPVSLSSRHEHRVEFEEADATPSESSVQTKSKRSQSAYVRLNTSRSKLSYSTEQKIRATKSARFMEVHGSKETLDRPESTGEDIFGQDGNDGNQTGRRTYLDDLDSGIKHKHVLTAADRNPMFVHFQTLTKGDVFGLNKNVFSDQPSLCLVSNGAECILIKSKYYWEHCPGDVERRLKYELSPYPEDTLLQEELLTRLNWDAYKKATVSALIKEKKFIKDKLGGQICV